MHETLALQLRMALIEITVISSPFLFWYIFWHIFTHRAYAEIKNNTITNCIQINAHYKLRVQQQMESCRVLAQEDCDAPPWLMPSIKRITRKNQQLVRDLSLCSAWSLIGCKHRPITERAPQHNNNNTKWRLLI